MIKKSLFLAVLSVASLGLVSCNGGSTGDPADGNRIQVGAMNGPTMIGLARLDAQSKVGETQNEYTFAKEGTPDGITAGLLNGSYDAAAVPANNASVLFNKGGVSLKVAAINTLNVLYLVENGNTITSLADLSGKTVYSPGKGSTPEYVFKHLLEANNIKDVNVQFVSEGTEIVQGLKQGTMNIGLLPQPAATSAIMGSETIGIRMDLATEWKRLPGNENKEIVTGVLVVRDDYLVNNKGTFNTFLDEYKASATFMTDAINIDVAAQYVVDLEIIPALPVAKAALPLCNVTFIEGDDMKTKLGDYLEILHSQNPASIGGELPGNGFYYSR